MARVSDFTVMASGGGAAVDGSTTAETEARLCHDQHGIQLQWQLMDQQIVTDNCGPGRNLTCSQCFDKVWQGDAAEFYLTDNLADMEQSVTEIDVSPMEGGVWAARIHNPTGYRPLSHVQIPCDKLVVSKDRVPGGWNASLSIPWQVLTNNTAVVPQAWRINFYRMDYSSSNDDSMPVVGLPAATASKNKHAAHTASAWAVTHCDGQKRCNVEHIPKYFGVAVLVQ